MIKDIQLTSSDLQRIQLIININQTSVIQHLTAHVCLLRQLQHQNHKVIQDAMANVKKSVNRTDNSRISDTDLDKFFIIQLCFSTLLSQNRKFRWNPVAVEFTKKFKNFKLLCDEARKAEARKEKKRQLTRPRKRAGTSGWRQKTETMKRHELSVAGAATSP